MQFNCQTVPLTKVTYDANGTLEPLCNTCCQTECTNPIREKTIIIQGLPHKWHVYAAGEIFHQVIQCDGFVRPK